MLTGGEQGDDGVKRRPTLKEFEERERTQWANRDPKRPGTWEQLIFDCAEGRKICNCGQAYETWHKDGCFVTGYSGEIGHWACAHGCQSAQFEAKDHVAKCIANEMYGQRKG